VNKLQKLAHNPSGNMASLQEVELWEISQDKFMEMIDQEYPLYRDITEPFISALQQVCISGLLMTN
jgi:hypothetical protein